MIDITDNFLPKEDFLHIKQSMENPYFDWYFNTSIVGYKETLYSGQLTHTFYYKFNARGSFPLLEKLIKKINPLSVIRVKANLSCIGNNIIEQGLHTDFNDKRITTAIFYINNNNGYTRFENGSTVESVENRFVCFNSSLKHTGTNCTNNQRRIVLNLNYIKNEI
jgi:hypothetical protein